ncbi:unnamed protein product [Closterium sp. NIES-53]
MHRAPYCSFAFSLSSPALSPRINTVCVPLHSRFTQISIPPLLPTFFALSLSLFPLKLSVAFSLIHFPLHPPLLRACLFSPLPPISFPCALCQYPSSRTLLPCRAAMPCHAVRDVSQNNLNGSLPSSLGEMTTLQHLDASVNSLSGTLPTSISTMQSLQLLDLSYNAFSSSLSAALPYLSSLTTLDLSHNKIQGALLPALATMPKLSILKLKANSLDGTVPSSLAPQLSFLDVSSNALVGPLPVSYFRMDNLTYLSFGFNSFTGRLPNLGALTKLRKLDIVANQFSGSLPPTFAPSIVSLEMHGNSFSGSLPNSLSRLVNLQSLDMARNNISGGVPDFPRAASLVFLSLVNNMISGPVSQELRNRAQVELSRGNAKGSYLQLLLHSPPTTCICPPLLLHIPCFVSFINISSPLRTPFQLSPPFPPHLPCSPFFLQVHHPSLVRPLCVPGASLSTNCPTPLLTPHAISHPTNPHAQHPCAAAPRLAGNPWCREPENQLLSVCSAAISNATMEWTPPEICPGLTCRNKETQAANTAIYSDNGTCECSDYLSVTLLLTSAPFSVFTSDIANKLRAELADRLRNYISGAPLLEQSQVAFASTRRAGAAQGGQWDVAVESNILNQLFLGSKYNQLLGADFGPYVLICACSLQGEGGGGGDGMGVGMWGRDAMGRVGLGWDGRKESGWG